MKVPFAFHFQAGRSSRIDRPRPRLRPCRRQAGVALVVTLILLAIITTLAIAFIALTHRETASVAAVSATTDAELAAEAGFQRAKGEILARILTANRRPVPNEIDPFGPGFMVSVAWDTNRLQTPSVAQPDLYRDPSPPVYVQTNLNRNLTLDDRHFLDLNQNQYFDETGLVPITTDARPRPTARYIRDASGGSNWVVGDPQWIGMLSYPTAAHGAENRFISRFAWAVLPAGQTLDINAIHNQALGDDFGLNMGDAAGGDGYHRFQGAGAWEINLAGFLADLNQPIWGPDYQFFPNAIPPQARALGTAYADAREILRYRYTPRYENNGRPILDLLNPPVRSEQLLDPGTAYLGVGSAYAPAVVDGLLGANGIDEFSDAAFVAPPFNSSRPWPGARNKRNFYTPHDLLNHSKIQHRNAVTGFIPRVQGASYAGNSYDRYTFYRLLTQLGTDSAPESDDHKININYVNVRSWNAPSDRPKASDLLTWSDRTDGFTNRMGRKGPELFFLSTVRRLLLEERNPIYTNFVPVLSWRDYDLPGWPTNAPVLDAGHPLLIPVGTNGVTWGYSGRVHQILQLAANIYDAVRGPEGTENAAAHAGMFPTIFRPRIELVNGIPHIVDYRLVEAADQRGIPQAAWVDLLAGQIGSGDYLAYNVPLILGARKGFPNFNEFGSRTSVQAVRRLEARKNEGQVGFPNVRLTETFTLYITNDFGMEAWNSYFSNSYPRPLQMIMTNIATVTVSRSNSAPLPGILPIRYGRVATIPANGWKRSKADTDDGYIGTNFPSVVVAAITNVQAVSKTGPDHPWRVTVRNQLRFFLFDTVAERLVDAVAISVTNDFFDVGQRLTEDWPGASGSAVGLWRVGSAGDTRLTWRSGINQQLLISAGTVPLSETEWRNYGPQSQNRTLGIQRFNAFLNEPEQTYTVVPFVPARVITQTNGWRVNDPLVHYTAEDLYRGSGYDSFANRAAPTLSMGTRNPESKPWPAVDIGANSSLDKSPAIKDPGVRTSDYWDFPTNKAASVGLLGRVHRGTPWQTVYFKADASTTNAFVKQSGIPFAFRADPWNNHVNSRRAGVVLASMQPTNDWRLLDIFSSAVHPNATLGRLSINQTTNQTNLAAWSAVLSGIQLRATARTNAGVTRYGSGDFVITPAALADANDLRTWQVESLAAGVLTNRLGARRAYTRLSDILSVPQFTYLSPVLTNTTFDPYSPPPQDYLYDSDYESLPEKVLGLLKLGEPRFVVYAWGQSLKPAEYGLTAPDADGNVRPSGPSLVTSGNNRGLVSNYQITGETAVRAVLRVEYERVSNNPNSPEYNVIDYRRPRIVVESFNSLTQD